MEYGDNYEVFTNSRREIAKSVSRGVANGAVNASSWLNSSTAGVEDKEPILTASEIEEVSQRCIIRCYDRKYWACSLLSY